jgi:hypothetical protein
MRLACSQNGKRAAGFTTNPDWLDLWNQWHPAPALLDEIAK